MPSNDSSALVEMLRDALAAQTAMLQSEFVAMRNEMKATRRDLTVVALVALALMAGMVGVGISYSGGTFSTHSSNQTDHSTERPVTFGMTLDGVIPDGAASASTDGQAVAPVPGYYDAEEGETP